MKVTITINYQSRNSLDENLAETEIKETIESLMMSLRNQVMNINHVIEFDDGTSTPEPEVKVVVEPTPVVEEVLEVVEETVKKAPVKKAPVKKPE